MTNICAAILITVTTNWTAIGTFTPTGNPWFTETVEQGRLATNTLLLTEWRHQKREFMLETTPGPVIGERRVPDGKNYLTNIIIPSPWIIASNLPIYITNEFRSGTLDITNITNFSGCRLKALPKITNCPSTTIDAEE